MVWLWIAAAAAMDRAEEGVLEALYPTVAVQAGEVALPNGRAQVTRGFRVGQTEVSQRLYQMVMGSNPMRERREYRQSGVLRRCADVGYGPEFPVVCVTWYDAVRLANRLSEQLGLEPVYSFEGSDILVFDDANGFRLLTDAEWSLTAAASPARDDICANGNVADLSAGAYAPSWKTFGCTDRYALLSPIGSFARSASEWTDWLGNAAEWVWDGFTPQASTGVDPVVDIGGDRVVRGGSWASDPALTPLTGGRAAVPAWDVNPNVGIRLARSGR